MPDETELHLRYINTYLVPNPDCPYPNGDTARTKTISIRVDAITGERYQRMMALAKVNPRYERPSDALHRFLQSLRPEDLLLDDPSDTDG